MAIITITIPRDPATPPSTKVEGVRGTSCRDLSAPLERSLGLYVNTANTEDYDKVDAPPLEEHVDDQ